MKLPDFSKLLLKSSHMLRPILPTLSAIPTDIFTEYALISSLNGRPVKKYFAVKMRQQQQL